MKVVKEDGSGGGERRQMEGKGGRRGSRRGGKVSKEAESKNGEG